jgi:hypothetical protein
VSQWRGSVSKSGHFALTVAGCFFFSIFVQPNRSYISLMIPLLEVPVSNLGRKPNAEVVRQIRPRPLPSTSIPVHYSASSHHFTLYNLVYWQAVISEAYNGTKGTVAKHCYKFKLQVLRSVRKLMYFPTVHTSQRPKYRTWRRFASEDAYFSMCCNAYFMASVDCPAIFLSSNVGKRIAVLSFLLYSFLCEILEDRSIC